MVQIVRAENIEILLLWNIIAILQRRIVYWKIGFIGFEYFRYL